MIRKRRNQKENPIPKTEVGKKVKSNYQEKAQSERNSHSDSKHRGGKN